MIHVLIFLAGFFLLFVGGESVLKGAKSFALAIGIRPVIIGLTIVALGTTAPELAVSFSAAMKNEGGIAFGNALGSCIINIGFILGLSAVISSVKIEQSVIKRELPFFIASTSILLFMCLQYIMCEFRKGYYDI